MISIFEFKQFNKLDQTNTELDNFIQLLIDIAVDNVINYLNYDFRNKDYVEVYDGDNTDRLILNNYPVNNVSSIAKYDSLSGNFQALVQGIDYSRLIIKDKMMIVLEGNLFEAGNQNYQIGYNAGYSEDELPKDIKLGLLELTSLYFNESSQGQGILFVIQKNRAQMGMTESFDKDAEQRIFETRFQKYRRYNV